MKRFLAAFALLVLVAGVRADDIESRLLQKFDQNAKANVEKLRKSIDDSVTKAKAVKETDPDAALEILRQASIRIDRTSLLSYADRKSLSEGIQPILQEMRDKVILRKRVEASKQLNLFRDYLEHVAPELRNPGRSGPGLDRDRWEPAYAVDPAGREQLVQLESIFPLKFKAGLTGKTAPPTYFPWIQVAGGFYVYDLAVGHHMWMSNRQFFTSIFMPLVDGYVAEDRRARGIGARSRSVSDSLIQAEIDNGVLFVRGLTGASPIPGLIERQEPEFLEWAAQRLLRKGLPTSISGIYDRDMLEQLSSLTSRQLSAAARSLQMLRQKGVATSKLYAEILREETARLIRSEYDSFADDAKMNRTLHYLFTKLQD